MLRLKILSKVFQPISHPLEFSFSTGQASQRKFFPTPRLSTSIFPLGRSDWNRRSLIRATFAFSCGASVAHIGFLRLLDIQSKRLTSTLLATQWKNPHLYLSCKEKSLSFPLDLSFMLWKPNRPYYLKTVPMKIPYAWLTANNLQS